MKTRKVLIPLLCLLLLWGPQLTEAESLEMVVVTLPERAGVVGTRIFLGEIGDVSGESELATKVKQASAGTAPLPGDSRYLTKGQIEVRLRQAGIDLSRLEFRGASTVQVYGMEKDIPLPDETFTYEVVVMQRDVGRGEILSTNDLAVEVKEAGTNMRQSGQLSDYIGLRTRRQLNAGTILSKSHVEIVPVIERGAQIRIIADMGSIYVTVLGTARGTGDIGDVIAVENTVSRQIVYGKILDGETVKVIVRGSDAL